MNSKKSSLDQGADARIAELVQTINAAERELQALAGGEVAAVEGTGGVPLLLREAQERLRTSEAAQRALAQSLAAETRRLHESQAVARVGSWETDLRTLALEWSAQTYRIFEVSPDAFQATHQRFLGLVHPDDRAEVDARFSDAAARSGSYALEHRICVPGGRIKIVEERWQTFADEGGQPLRAVGTCQDITDRKRSEDLLRTRTRQQEVIAQIGFETTRATSLQAILDFTTRALAEALGVEMGAVFQLTPDGSNLQLVSGLGWPPGIVGVATVGADERSHAGLTLRSAGPLIVDDFRREDRFSAPPLLTEHEVVSGLSVTISLLDKPWGVLGAHSRSVRTFGEQDAQFTQAVATLLSVVIGRLASQRRLTESEGRMHDAQRIAHLGNWELEIAANRLTWSEETYRIFGVTPQTVVGTYEAFRARVHPDDWERLEAAQRRALAGEGPLDIEHRVIRPDGEIRHVWEQGELIYDGQGRPSVLAGTVLDITERRIATEQLRQREELLRQNQTMLSIAGRAAKLGGWSIDLPAFKVTWSDETALIHDLEPGHAPNIEEAIEFYPPEYREAVSAAVRLISTQGVPFDFEHELITARKRRIWVRAIGEARRNEAGEVVRINGAFQDITERKIADLALVASNRALQLLSRCNEALVRSTNEATLLKDICQIAVEVGGFAMAWVGYAQDDADRTVAPQTFAGAEGGYLTDVVLSWSEDHPNGRGPAGQVIRSGEPMVIPDVAQDPSFAPWLAKAHAQGYAGVVVLPLKNHKRTFGVFVLYASSVRTPREDELGVLRELADDLAFGIGNLRSQEQRRQLESALVKVAASVSANVGADFFRELAMSAAEAMNADGAFVARLLPGQPARALTVAAVLDGQVVENFEYALSGTPCEKLLEGEDCVVPTDAARHFPNSPRLVAARAAAYVGRRLVSADGQVLGMVYVLFRKPLTDSGFVLSTLQIFAARAAGEFERLSADTRIREQAALLDKATDAIIVRDLAHRVLFWNPAAERMFGWSAAEALGQPTIAFLFPTLGPFEAAVSALLANGEWTGELNKKTRSKHVVTVECRWTLVRNEQGEPRSVLCIETDITERKKLEAQFLRAQRMESVGTMASGIAHDMNNILAPIMMSIEILKEDARDEETLDTLSTLESSSQRAADLVQQLLAFARGIDGQKTAVDIRPLILDLQKVLKDVFPKDVEFGFSAGRELWKINGDSSQLHQVFMNLCVNARDAMPRGGKLMIEVENVVLDEVYAAMNPHGRSGAFVVVGVTDTGTGMPPAVLDKIFEPFFTTKELGKGTGLGLSTVMGIVKNHGGFVNAYSEEGKGTQFKVYLPAQASNDEREEAVITQSKIPRGQGQLILLVDDEVGVREIATKTLTRLGYRVLQAANGAEAVALYVQHQAEIALVLTDVSMPIMDGVALITALRSLNHQVRVLISSGLPVNAGVAKAMEWGAARFIPKPYTADRLLRIISEELHRA